MVFRREKEPNCGLNIIEKVGFGWLGLEGLNEKLAFITRGDLLGEPKRPVPDLRVRVRGGVVEAAAAEEVVVVE